MVHDKFDRGEVLLIKGTFHFRCDHLIAVKQKDVAEEEILLPSFEPLRFKVANLEGDYFVFDPDIVQIGYPLLIYRNAQITWKWFTAERRTSIFRVISEIRPARVVIGGTESDAIPEAVFEKLISKFPTSHELK
ncbi:MAG: hypothetical protein HZB47_14695 [Nitrosomonadales bacterium]|nr:hypothetical protein [Nitrosomonadales bacterium]